MSEAEDRTQAPSKLRRQQARERGQAAHSPELTAAAALLAAASVLSWCGPVLVTALLGLVRQPLLESPVLSLSADGTEITAQLRGHASAIVVPPARQTTTSACPSCRPMS